MSRRGSAEGGSGGGESEVVVLKRRRLVPAAPLYAGLARFSFMLDATQPGALPDALFMAALLELVSEGDNNSGEYEVVILKEESL